MRRWHEDAASGNSSAKACLMLSFHKLCFPQYLKQEVPQIWKIEFRIYLQIYSLFPQFRSQNYAFTNIWRFLQIQKTSVQ